MWNLPQGIDVRFRLGISSILDSTGCSLQIRDPSSVPSKSKVYEDLDEQSTAGSIEKSQVEA
jgi:hypothetical protein